MTRRLLVPLMLVLVVSVGCNDHYVTPGPPADFRELGLEAADPDLTPSERSRLTDAAIERQLRRRPLATFPANLAITSIQGTSHGSGRIYIDKTRTEADTEVWSSVAEWPGVRGVTPVPRMLAAAEIESEVQLREAAASLQCDLLLLVTRDTRIVTDEKIPYAGLFTLGLFPDRSAEARCTATSILVDVRNGYVYGVAEATAERDQAASAWTNDEAIEDAVEAAEDEATRRLATETRRLWDGVIARYAPGIAGGT